MHQARILNTSSRRLIVAALIAVTGAAHAAPTYRIVNLGALQSTSQAIAINDAGTVVGVSDNDAFRWTPAEKMMALPRAGTSAVASALDSAGRAVGSMAAADGRPLGVVWRPSGESIAFADPGNAFVVNVNGVNDRGQAVGGIASRSRFRVRATLWEPGGETDLGALSSGPLASAQAMAINNLGVVVGQSTVGADERESHAFIWHRLAGMRDLGTLFADRSGFSIAYDVNDAGVAVGSSAAPTGQFAFAWTLQGGMRSLGSLPGSTLSEAYGIDERGRVVGRAFVGNGNRGFLWIRGEGMRDLNALIDPNDPLRSRTVFQWANDINARGQIVGIGLVDGQTRALMLSPVAH